MKMKPMSLKMIIALLIIMQLLTASGCVVVKHSDIDGENQDGDPLKYSAEAYREENWNKVVENIVERAADASEVLASIEENIDAAGDKYGRRAQQTGSAWNFGIKGNVKVVEVNTDLKAGTVLVDIEPYDGNADFTLQVGPVFRTNCIRDFTEFIRFDDFSNQVEYANLTGAFNRAVTETVLNSVNEWQVGAEYFFAGAFTWQNSSEPEKIQVIPVQLSEAGG